jgi:hypothetical protein
MIMCNKTLIRYSGKSYVGFPNPWLLQYILYMKSEGKSEVEFLIEVRTRECAQYSEICTSEPIWKGREKTCYKYEGICP